MGFAARPCFSWLLRTRRLALGPSTIVMGILNVTPDSFSDGGIDGSPREAIDRGVAMLDEGADVVDLGGESTRPDAVPVSPEVEQARILPIIAGILRARGGAVLSIDTYHAETARMALGAGAEIVNDVSGHLWDPAMSATCATLGCGAVLMHSRGRPQEWASLPRLDPGEVVPLVGRDLSARVQEALAAGVLRDAIVLDPGFGFGKLGSENFSLLAGLDRLQALGYPLLAGLSRKGFLASHLPPPRRTQTMAANTAAVLAGAHILRVHDVSAALEAAAVADAILLAG